MTHIESSLKRLVTTYGLQKQFITEEMDHDEAFEDTWLKKKDECFEFAKKRCFMYCFWLP